MEIRRGKFRNALSDDPAKELTKLGTRFEIRHLKVGDFVWISRHKNGKELTLPYVVERKRMDDLGGSIKDGRFHEQKVCIYVHEYFCTNSSKAYSLNSFRFMVLVSFETMRIAKCDLFGRKIC